MPNDFIFNRKNPFYVQNEQIWRRSLAAYSGGARYIRQALVRHVSEVKPEYEERLKRGYYANYPRRVATMITQCVLSHRPERAGIDPEIAEDFSRTGLRVDEVMRQFSTLLNVFGCAWLAVDMPSYDGMKSKEDERRERLRPYCLALNPLQVRDWRYGSDGELDWVIVAETEVDNRDPLKSVATYDVRKLWTREGVTVFRRGNGVDEERTIVHGLGRVPFVRYVDTDGYGIDGSHWFEDVVRISDGILNASSEAQMNVVKQMFGLLVIPQDFIDSAETARSQDGQDEGKEKLSVVLARSAALYESESAKGTCRYISPNGAATEVIRAEIDAMRKELFNVVGLALAKDTRMVESAESKAWDYMNIEQYMATRADVLEQCETQAWRLIHLWMPSIPEPKSVSYIRNFSIFDLQDAVASLLQLSGFNQWNDQYQREIGKTAVTLLNRLRQMPQDVQSRIVAEIQKSTPSAENAQAMADEMAVTGEGDELAQ